MAASRSPQAGGELEIRVRAGENGLFPVELRWSGGQDLPAGVLAGGSLLPWVDGLSPQDDGERLFRALFADPPLAAAWAEVKGESPVRRLRLRLDPEAAELHTLPWERLAEPGAHALGADPATPFSRYFPSRSRPSPPVVERPVRMLVAIANPAELPSQLAAIVVEEERASLEAALGEAPTGELAVTWLTAGVSLAALEAALREGFHVLHLLAHGVFSPRTGKAAVYLADAQDAATAVAAEDFAALLGRLASPPRLVFLASCQTAERSPRDSFQGFAPQLLLAGAPAVLAMQRTVPMPTARTFAAAFYRRLLTHGQVDLATNEARSAVLTERLRGADVPVLFLRLASGRLFGHRGEVEGKPPELFWHTLLRNVSERRLTPLLGPGIHHGLLPMPRQLARTLASAPEYGYPDAGEESLPRVAQFLASYEPDLPHRAVAEILVASLRSLLPAAARELPARCVSELARAARWAEPRGDGGGRGEDGEVHHQLAALELPLYLTTNWDNLLTLALAARGRAVRRLALPWRAAQRGEPLVSLELDAPPTPEEPVVFHLFGIDEDPESLVLCEDDYLDYLTVISRSESNLLPSFVSEALAYNGVLFLGYRLGDLDLRVLLRGFLARLDTGKWRRRSQVAVQFDPKSGGEPGGEAARAFLVKYFGQSQIDLYWGSAPQFVADLVSRLPGGLGPEDRHG